MPNESGDLKLLGNFRKLIDLVSGDTNYQPSNASLMPAALNTQYTAALTAAEDVPDKLSQNITAISDREVAFRGLPTRITRVHGLAKASGAPKHLIDDLNIFRRKLTSKRKAKPKPGAVPPLPPTDNEQSRAQQSYDNLLGHAAGYLAVLKKLASYNPNEADLKMTALESFADDLRSKNDAVSASFVPLSQSRGLRDQLLYQAENSIVNHAALVKEHVKGAYGTKSQLYKQIKGLEFRRRRA